MRDSCIFISLKILMGLFQVFRGGFLARENFSALSRKFHCNYLRTFINAYFLFFDFHSVVSKLPDSQEMKCNAYTMCVSLFVVFCFNYSFEGVVAYHIRYSIIALDHLFSVSNGTLSLEEFRE